MADKSKWFVYKKDEVVFGCFRIRPFNDPNFDKALKMFSTKKSVIRMSEMKATQEFVKIIATYLIYDWENIEISATGIASEKETRYSPEEAYQMLMFGNIGSELALWILEKSKSIV